MTGNSRYPFGMRVLWRKLPQVASLPGAPWAGGLEEARLVVGKAVGLHPAFRPAAAETAGIAREADLLLLSKTVVILQTPLDPFPAFGRKAVERTLTLLGRHAVEPLDHAASGWRTQVLSRTASRLRRYASRKEYRRRC